MNPAIEWHNETIGKKVVEALGKNNIKASYVKDSKGALEKAMKLINKDDVIALGGSVTKFEIGLVGELKKQCNRIIDWYLPELTPEQRLAARREGMVTDVFLTSSNAITLDGQLINIDGTGNRVAAMVFGPKRIILIAGVNKIVPDIEAGIKRIQTFAAPANNKRLELPNPCTKTGICMNCNSPHRICNVTTIMHKCPTLTDISIIIVGQALGF